MTKYFSILILLAFYSCNQDNQTFDIGGKYVNVQSDLRFVDTLTVNSYTVKLDSIRTSGITDDQGAVVAGNYHDPELGNISASSYFKLSLPNTRSVPSNAVFDSLRLIMVYNDYIIGDTLKPVTLNVHRVSQVINVNDDGYLYNTSEFNYFTEPLGSKTFRARPYVMDTLSIHLSDDFGNELLDLFLEKDERILQLDNWLSYFKGLTIQGDLSNDIILGYTSTYEMPVMRLYYHYNEFSRISQHRDFTILTHQLNQFNHFEITNPLFDLPENQKDKLPAIETDNHTYIQAGTGIVTRIEIPHLKNLLQLHENMQILRAELIIEPVRNSYKIIPLPQRISLFQSDNQNHIGSVILNGNSTSPLVGILVIDEIYQEETSYTFDVTNFIQTKIIEPTDDIPSLLVTVTPNEVYTTADRFVAGSQVNSNSTIKVKIYYMNY